MSQPHPSIVLTPSQRRIVAELVPDLADRLKLGERNSRTIAFSPEELKTIRRRVRAARERVVGGTRQNSLRHIDEAVELAMGESAAVRAIPASQRIYEFKVTLLEAEPPIWRRIRTRNCTLDRLHHLVQAAMGWTNSHLYSFEIDGTKFGDPWQFDDAEEFEESGWLDSTRTRIADLLPRSGKRYRFEYVYDFGDYWQHGIAFEGCSRAETGTRYPLCVAGARACPPEDCGGVLLYAEFLEALADPHHERHAEALEWRGPFDPEAFDAAKATQAMHEPVDPER